MFGKQACVHLWIGPAHGLSRQVLMCVVALAPNLLAVLMNEAARDLLFGSGMDVRAEMQDMVIFCVRWIMSKAAVGMTVLR